MPHTHSDSMTHHEVNLECPECGAGCIRTDHIAHRFKYGIGDGAVELCCELPLRVCQECGTQFVDEEGESAQHDAVCRHLRLMTPREIQEVRERYEATQAEFSELSGIGEASLSRWENGATIQTKAYDNYLYLLTSPENVQRLRRRTCGGQALQEEMSPTHRKFRCIDDTPARRAKQSRFDLRRAS